jgi:demethylmenaquinone methyltransferase/2-methoxy-6-polyprenyl-1,4-benzoquinol methylase
MSQTIGQETVLKLLQGTAADYDRMVDESTLGLDTEWKAALISKMHQPRHVLDLACGTGILTFMVLQRFPEALVTGVDLQWDYLAIAEQRSQTLGLTSRTEFHHAAVEDFEGNSKRYDHVISCYLPKYAELDILVSRLLTWSAPRARVILHDFTHPTDEQVERNLQRHYDRWLQRASRKNPHWVTCFRDLYSVVRDSDWSVQLPRLLRDAGFEDVRTESCNHDCAAFVTAIAPA